MRKLFNSRLRFVFFPIIGIAFLFLVGFLVMQLWNYTLPSLFGIQTINLWQSIALFFLCKLLFGFGGGGPKRGGPGWRRKIMRGRQFERMSEAEKERVREYMRRRSCGWDDYQEDTSAKEENHRSQDQ